MYGYFRHRLKRRKSQRPKLKLGCPSRTHYRPIATLHLRPQIMRGRPEGPNQLLHVHLGDKMIQKALPLFARVSVVVKIPEHHWQPPQLKILALLSRAGSTLPRGFWKTVRATLENCSRRYIRWSAWEPMYFGRFGKGARCLCIAAAKLCAAAPPFTGLR